MLTDNASDRWTPNLAVELQETDGLILNRKALNHSSYTTPTSAYSSLSSIVGDNEMVIILIGTAAGNFLEWYNFAIFGLMADIFGLLFFPGATTTMNLLQIYVLYAIVFLMRPIGGIIFGIVGDRWGRLQSLKLSIILMALSTFCMAILPTYHSIGISATILMIMMRLIQGLSVGGELTGVMIYMVELCPPQHRSVFAILVQVTGMGGLLASAMIAIMTATCTPHQILQWAWRIPFFFGCVIGLFGVWARMYLKHETPAFKRARRHGDLVENPVKYAFKTCKWRMLSIIIHAGFSSFGYYVYFVWFPTYFSVISGYQFNVFAVNVVGMLLQACAALFSAHCVDTFKNITSTKVLLGCGSIHIVMAIVSFRYLNNPDDALLAIVIWLILSLSFGLYYGIAAGIWLIDILPDITCRNTAFGIGYNISQALFGGTATLIATFAYTNLDGIYSIAWIVFIIGTMSLVNDTIACWIFQAKKVTIL